MVSRYIIAVRYLDMSALRYPISLHYTPTYAGMMGLYCVIVKCAVLRAVGHVFGLMQDTARSVRVQSSRFPDAFLRTFSAQLTLY
jgi:hypothetical protein